MCVAVSRGRARLQYAHAHSHHDADFFFAVHGQGPNYLPGEDRQDHVHGAGVDCVLLFVRRDRERRWIGGRGLLTRRENVVPDLDALWPALAYQVRMPRLLDGRALRPGDGDGHAETSVHGDDDEPDQGLEPAGRDAQHRDGKRSFAPQGGENREAASQVGEEKKNVQVVHVELAEGPAEAHVYTCRDEGGVCHKGKL